MIRDIIVKPGGGFEQHVPVPLVPDDVNAYRVVMQTDTDLTGHSLLVTAIRADNQRIVGSGSVEGRTATAILSSNMYSVEGFLRLRLTLTGLDGSVLTEKELSCNVIDGNDIDDAAQADDRFPVLASAINQAQAAAAYANEGGSYAQEQGSAAEIAAKYASEQGDIAKAIGEAAATDEANRALAEESRAAEERERVAAEAERIAGEVARAGSEELRNAAEEARAGAETNRQEAEKTRSTQETSRVGAEISRAAAERTRVTTEANRNKTFNSYIAAIEGGPVASINGHTGIVTMPKGKPCRIIIGTKKAGWTADDCDYLCDGTADNAEIRDAIAALPVEGGEIVLLDGTYNLAAGISLDKSNLTFRGSGAGTILKVAWTVKPTAVLIAKQASGSCVIRDLTVDGSKDTNANSTMGIAISASDVTVEHVRSINNKSTGISIGTKTYRAKVLSCHLSNNANGINLGNGSYQATIWGNNSSGNAGVGIYLLNAIQSTVTNNICLDNTGYGIQLYHTQNTVVSGNICANCSNGIYAHGRSLNNIIASNYCYDNAVAGINVSGIKNAEEVERVNIIGNIAMRGTGTAEDYTAAQHTIRIGGARGCMIADNIITGKNYVEDGGTNNTFANNKYN